MVCSNYVKLSIGDYTLKDAVVNMLPGETLDLGGGIYGGSMSCNITITVSNIVIRGTSGPDHTVIDCNNQERHFIILSSNVSITGLHLKGGTAVNKSAPLGGCIYVLGQNTSISNSRFSGCFADSGGAIAATGSGVVDIQNITVVSSTANFGAAIFSQNSIFIQDSTFYDNVADMSGGALYISKGPTDSKRIQVRLVGNNKFSNNTAQDGGAIFIDGGSSGASVLLEGTALFYRNRGDGFSGSQYCPPCSGKGGAILAENFVDLDLKGSAFFQSNTAVLGGGIYVSESSSVTFSGVSELKENTAAIGGAIFIGDLSTLRSENTTNFIRNQANVTSMGIICSDDACESIGGSIYSGYTNSSIFLSGNTVFADNYADYGGAIHTEGLGGQIQVGGYTFFTRNRAKYGGAVSIDMDQSFRANFSGSANFSRNTAFQDGGALHSAAFVTGKNDCVLTLFGLVSFESNQAAGYGGAVNVEGSITINLGGNVQFIENKAQRGGGIAVQGISSTTSLTTLKISDFVLFKGNFASMGGALSSSVNVLASLSGHVMLTSNIATYSGGGVSVDSSSQLYINESVLLVSNTAGGNGGAVYVNDHSYLSLADTCIVKANKGLNGGGVSIEMNSNLTVLQHVNFTSNNAMEDGGAISASDATFVRIEKTFMENNSANNNGGALSLSQTSWANISDSQILKNRASVEGGAIYISLFSTLITTAKMYILNNNAQCGGAIAIR